MNKTLLIIGVVLIALGIFAGAYSTSQSHLWGAYTTTSNPYSSYSIPLIIGGVILIIVGAVIKKSEK